MTNPQIALEKSEHSIPLIIEEMIGIPRNNEPVTVGIPFPRGIVKKTTELAVLDPQNHEIPFQSQVLDTWNDRSLKWVLFDFQVTVAANTRVHYGICLNKSEEFVEAPLAPQTGIVFQETPDSMIVNTTTATFVVDKTVFHPFREIVINDVNIIDPAKSRMVLLDEVGQEYTHAIRHIFLETKGPLRITVKVEGHLIGRNKDIFAEFFARLYFYANSSVNKIEYTIRNPKAAQHPGGLWDLGDERSVYFNDLSLHLAISSSNMPTVEWTTQPEHPLIKSEAGKIEIYQDSSGGVNWNSSNHVNRFGKVMHSFCGYRVRGNELIEEGKRANPVIVIHNEKHKITGAILQFWQNFPKALEANGNILTIRIFPEQYQDLFELQGGEQKTHTVFLSFETSPLAKASGPSQGSLNWIQDPLIPHAPPEWYASSKAFDYITTHAQDHHPEVIALINSAIEGENTFDDRKELIDEYGWRNFGDLYADHEKVYYQGEGVPISHYNNQYDCIYGMSLQYIRSGSVKWFGLMNDLAHHVIDIDIYHTNQDRPNFSGGLFWHTDHYADAGTATHRSFSKMTMLAKGLSYYGGGPSNEHNYPTGLRYHYYLTGEVASKETAIGLADWVIRMDDGTKTKYRYLNCRPTGWASKSGTYDYHGPGRGSGYSINALLDGYLLTRARKYLVKAEEIIRRCIHPHDDIEARELTNAEARWFYTVFLQAIGRYLDLKVELDELDEIFCYACESLLHYATWMRDHEARFVTIFDTVEYPTETWPAQDIRKSNVFMFAAKYAQEPLRSQFLEKSKYFFDKPIEDLFTFDTRTLTRPLILLMTNIAMHAYFHQHPDETGPIVESHYNFGQPQQFKPQLYYLYKFREKLFHIVNSIKTRFGK